ncbi:DciA family protein [Rothia sp. AR01]|uniref:DciA family protein n=1 Tax=Rothia santali TaxID=2949643 RepID=A0A9X2KH51_9MICC|nr:DciA family protein [Rothia santali]MCP3425512.1 DciA family protein [Rothia santali]
MGEGPEDPRRLPDAEGGRSGPGGHGGVGPAAETPAERQRRRELEHDEVDAPASLLQRLRSAAVARGEGRLTGNAAKKVIREFGEVVSAEPGQAKKNRWREEGWDPRILGGYSGPGKSSRDPQGLGSVMGHMIASRGWKEPVAVGSVLARWGDLVGPALAAHTSPEHFENSEVTIRCDSTNYATVLRTMIPQLMQTFERELGHGIVTKISVLGPSVPSWKKGRRVAPGGRGPRDTYG